MYICSNCGNESPKWMGQCLFCKEWNTLQEKKIDPHAKKITGIAHTPKPMPKASEEKLSRILCESAELNTVLGGGVVPGSLTLLFGEPGIGKSTLTLQMADWSAKENKQVLYISAEEWEAQIAGRAARLGIKNDNIHVIHEQNLENILMTLEKHSYGLVILDSISMMTSSQSTSYAGSIPQMRTIAEQCMKFAKSTGTALCIIGHVNKEWDLGGPKVLEHIVDTVLQLEGDRFENYRIIRSIKNRFGPTHEVGIFSMNEKGLEDIADPTLEFTKKDISAPGIALTMSKQGSRPMFLEIEALTQYSKFWYPKRSSRGISSGKLDLMIAIINRFTDVNLSSDDVYVNIARGMRTDDPTIDLAIIAAIISAKKKIPLNNTLFLGEVGLTGNIKPVSHFGLYQTNLEKIGWKKICMHSKKTSSKKIEISSLKSISELVGVLEEA